MLIFAVSLLHDRKVLFWHNWLKKLQNDKEIAESRKMIPKEKNLFGKGNLFSSTYSSESAISCYKNPEKIFSTKGPTFFISKSEEVWYIVQFSKKLLNLRIFERCASCSFGNHAGSFSLKVQKKFRSKWWNKRIETSVIIRESWNVFRLASKMLLWTCSSGPIECGFDKSPSNFLLNFQVPLLDTWKKFAKTFATEIFSLNFCSVRLSCDFDTQG